MGLVNKGMVSNHVASLTARLPGLAAGDMAVCVRRLFKCDDRLGQLIIIKVGIDGAEHLF